MLDRIAELKKSEEINKTLLTPTENEKTIIEKTNKIWFGIESDSTLNEEGVPVLPQIWGFDQVETPFL
ncbi:hypothetical protein KJ966_15215 [bacterium]|nr:hypothetical protein [bacterium]